MRRLAAHRAARHEKLKRATARRHGLPHGHARGHGVKRAVHHSSGHRGRRR